MSKRTRFEVSIARPLNVFSRFVMESSSAPRLGNISSVRVSGAIVGIADVGVAIDITCDADEVATW